MQPIKKTRSMASKLFGLTPMGMAFNAGNKAITNIKKFAGSKTFSNIKNIGKKAFALSPMGIMAKKMGIAGDKIKNIFMPKGEQTVNLTELTDKTIQENRASADAKTQKQVDVAAGTGAALAAAGSSSPYQQEGGALAQPEIIESPYIDVYNTTSQF